MKKKNLYWEQQHDLYEELEWTEPQNIITLITKIMK